MRIEIEEALVRTATLQRLIERPAGRSAGIPEPVVPGAPVAGENSAVGEGLAVGENSAVGEILAVVGAVGGLNTALNHVPFLSMAARVPQFRPQDLHSDQRSPSPALVRVSGPDAGCLMVPVERAPAFAKLAAVTGAEEATHLLKPLGAAEIRAVISWVSRGIKEQGKTYPELRQGAPPDVMQAVQRGSPRDLHQETAMHQVLEALVVHGELVTTLAAGVNTSEGPYRYHMRSRLAPGPLPTVEDAYIQVAEFYMQAFAPAGVRDFMAWSGLNEHAARRAIGGTAVPLRTVEIRGLGDDLLIPEAALAAPAVVEPACFVIPWLDNWLHAYRDYSRFAPEGVPGDVAPRDLVLVSVGPGVPLRHTLAARIRIVGSARSPRLEPEVWRPLAAHEQEALQSSLELVSRLFCGDVE